MSLKGRVKKEKVIIIPYSIIRNQSHFSSSVLFLSLARLDGSGSHPYHHAIYPRFLFAFIIIIIITTPFPPLSSTFRSKHLKWFLDLDSKLLQILVMLFILLHSLENHISAFFTILLSPLFIKFLIGFDRFLL